MIELLQNEINVVPGASPVTPPDRGWVGQGRVVLSITNETSQNNAYRINLECHHHRWKQEWVSFVALPPDNPSAMPRNQEDVYGPNNTWVQIYVPSQMTRRVVLQVQVKRLPEARAGAYPLHVVVQVSIPSQHGGWIEDSVHRLEAVALIRPFYQWRLRSEPEEQRVGLFKRSRQFEFVAENSGNDWLYLEIEPARPQNILIQQPDTVRVAVPPPEDNHTPSVRTLPIKASTKIRQFRGMRQPTPLPLNAHRVEAPSLPDLPQTAMQAPGSAEYRNAVIQHDPDQRDAQKPASDSSLTYCPPIPSTMEGCGKAIVQNLKGFIALALGLFILLHVIDFMAANMVDLATIRGKSEQAENDQEKFELEGSYLYKTKVTVVDAKTGDPLLEPQDPKVEGDFNTKKARYFISLKGIEDHYIKLTAKRKTWFSWLGAVVPSVKAKTAANKEQKIRVGNPPLDEYKLNLGPISPGKAYVIGTPGYASQVKRVMLGGSELKGWTAQGNESIGGTAPADLTPGQVHVAVFGDNPDKALAEQDWQISKEIQITMPTPTPSTSGVPGTDTGGAGGSGGSGGGVSSGPAGAIINGNPQGAIAAAQASPDDPEVLALAAVACYQSGKGADGDRFISQIGDRRGHAQIAPLVKLAEAVKAARTGGNPVPLFQEACQGVLTESLDIPVVFVVAIQTLKPSNPGKANEFYAMAKQANLSPEGMQAVEKAMKG